MDLSSNPVAALCLDDMKEYYVGISSSRSNASHWTVPKGAVEPIQSGYQIVNEASFIHPNHSYKSKINVEFQGKTRKDYAVVTYRDGCYEFLIGIHTTKKRILYTRIDYLDFNYLNLIENWYNGQTTEEVIKKVKEDFQRNLSGLGQQRFEQILRGINPDNE